MKLTHNVQGAQVVSSIAIPAPFDKYYQLISDADVEALYGIDAHPSPCEEQPGYDVESISYVSAKPEYIDTLSDLGLDVVELIKEGNGQPKLAYTAAGRIYPVTIEDLSNIESDGIEAAIDTGLEYWYSTRHGLGPGMMPPGVNILDTYEEGYKTWFKVDKLFTTEELNEYDIQESWPPAGAVTRHGEVIEGCDNITASYDYDEDFGIWKDLVPRNELVYSIQQALGVDDEVANIIYDWYDLEDIWEDFDSAPDFIAFMKSDIRDMIDACDDEYEKEKVLKAIESCTDINSGTVNADKCTKVAEDDDSISYIISSDDIEAASLVNYNNYKLYNDPGMGGWEILSKDHELVKSGFPSEKAAREYIDNTLLEVKSSTSISSAIDIDSIDLVALKDEIAAGCEEYLTGPEGGFLPSGSEKESRWDMTADEIYNIDIKRQPSEYSDGDQIKVEVRAELDYDGMSALVDILDPIVEKYDKNAYFDHVTGGIIEAYISDDSDITGATDFDRALSDHEQRWLDPDYDAATGSYVDSEIEDKDPLEIDFDFDFDVDVFDDGSWQPSEGSDPYVHADDYTAEGVDPDRLDEDFSELLIWNIPDVAGKYHVEGKAHLEYDYANALDDYPTFDSRRSRITDYTYSSAGKIESSTDIKAVMTEEELDNAILDGRPFDLESFRKYKNPGDPNAIKGRDVEVGDIIDIEFDASEVNLGTVVKVLSINEKPESWIDFTFKVEVLESYGNQALKVGDIIDLHFDADEEIGYIIPNY